MPEEQAPDPTAALDQLGAGLRGQAQLIASYYGHLRSEKVPPSLAAKLTLVVQERLADTLFRSGR